MILRGYSADNKPIGMYTILERRVAEKHDYFDWKISYLGDEENFREFCEKIEGLNAADDLHTDLKS